SLSELQTARAARARVIGHALSMPPGRRSSPALRPLLGRQADHDVHAGRQLANLRFLDRLEIDQDQLPLQRVAQAAELPVPPVLRMAVDEELGGEQFPAALLDLDVDVRGSAGIRHQLDGTEAMLALGAGGEAAEALEVGIASPPWSRSGSATP